MYERERERVNILLSHAWEMLLHMFIKNTMNEMWWKASIFFLIPETPKMILYKNKKSKQRWITEHFSLNDSLNFSTETFFLSLFIENINISNFIQNIIRIKKRSITLMKIELQCLLKTCRFSEGSPV